MVFLVGTGGWFRLESLLLAAVMVVAGSALTQGGDLADGPRKGAERPDGGGADLVGGTAYRKSLDAVERRLIAGGLQIAGRTTLRIDQAFIEGLEWHVAAARDAGGETTEITVTVNNRSGRAVQDLQLVLHAVPTGSGQCGTAPARFGWLPVGLAIPVDCIGGEACTIASSAATLESGGSRDFRAMAIWEGGGEACVALHGRFLVGAGKEADLAGFFFRAPMAMVAGKGGGEDGLAGGDDEEGKGAR